MPKETFAERKERFRKIRERRPKPTFFYEFLPEKEKQYSKKTCAKWRKENIERAREICRKWQHNNKEKMYTSQKAWRKKNPDKVNEISRRSYQMRKERRKMNCKSIESVTFEDMMEFICIRTNKEKTSIVASIPIFAITETSNNNTEHLGNINVKLDTELIKNNPNEFPTPEKLSQMSINKLKNAFGRIKTNRRMKYKTKDGIKFSKRIKFLALMSREEYSKKMLKKIAQEEALKDSV